MKPKQLPVYQVIDGLKYSNGYTAKHMRQALSYMPKYGDIVMVSYVKVGNNWLEQIIQLIFHRGESASGTVECHQRTPYPELVGTEYLENMPPPRFMKNHFDYSRQPINPKARYVYLARNPLDVCVSFFHYTRSIDAYKFQDGNFEDFFELFVSGETDWGDYLDHLASWYTHRNDDNVIFITYEQLKRDFRTTVLKVARFLGEKYEEMLLYDNQVYNKGKVRPVTLVRKGIIGDWKTLFSAEHLTRMKNRLVEKGVAHIVADVWRHEDLGGVV
ncbi:sulfotransferase ssu-1-like [Haemaphysalis longicornis]